ncbi:Phytochrome-like protein cph1 [Planctomycetes bacterium Pan216]|uniref:histidine kinase n=1 Tax=Kolteria novifilia TaxID=2527975 RepID=A0A518BBF5_9BACT|nr:Phytochrome-like protein cph1 [Planctomycetes bacterium Pan216]
MSVSALFDTSQWPPRWYCGNWTNILGWTHILSDLAIFIAYVSIPIALAFFVYRRRTLPFPRIFLLFGLFILACGMTHLMEAIIFWWPMYRMAGALKLFTAVVSIITVFALIPVIPQAMALPTPEESGRRTAELEQSRAALAEVARELERSNYELREFTHVASHDLQAPVRRISALIDLLVESSGDRLNGEERDYLNRIQGSCVRMHLLVDNLLDLSRVTRKRMTYESVDLGDAAAKALEDLAEDIRESSAEIVVEDLPVIPGDATLLRRMIQNLVANSIRFQAPGRTPRIRIHDATDEQQGSAEVVKICISDNGIGFDDRYADKLFRAFYRLDQASGVGGSGIGLAICKRVAEYHGGTITTSGVAGQGATFVVTLRRTRRVVSDQ